MAELTPPCGLRADAATTAAKGQDPVGLVRRAARLVVIDPESGAIVLFQYEDAGRQWWATPGGGLDGHETFEDAAVREAEEELPITCGLLEPLWQRTSKFSFRGTPIRQHEQYFLVRAAQAEVQIGPALRTAHAEEGIIAVRWWSPDEIALTSETVFPEDLSHRLRALGRP